MYSEMFLAIKAKQESREVRRRNSLICSDGMSFYVLDWSIVFSDKSYTKNTKNVKVCCGKEFLLFTLSFTEMTVVIYVIWHYHVCIIIQRSTFIIVCRVQTTVSFAPYSYPIIYTMQKKRLFVTVNIVLCMVCEFLKEDIFLTNDMAVTATNSTITVMLAIFTHQSQVST